MFWTVSRLNEKSRKQYFNSTTVTTFTYRTGSTDIDKKASVEKVFLTMWSEVHYMFNLSLQGQRKELNIYLNNKIVNSKNNRPDVVERMERCFRPLYLDQE